MTCQQGMLNKRPSLTWFTTELISMLQRSSITTSLSLFSILPHTLSSCWCCECVTCRGGIPLLPLECLTFYFSYSLPSELQHNFPQKHAFLPSHACDQSLVQPFSWKWRGKTGWIASVWGPQVKYTSRANIHNWHLWLKLWQKQSLKLNIEVFVCYFTWLVCNINNLSKKCFTRTKQNFVLYNLILLKFDNWLNTIL